MVLPATKEPRNLEQSALGPVPSQPEQQDTPQESAFVKNYIELVTHLKELDARNEMEMEERAAQEHVPDNQESEAGPSSKHLEGDKEGRSSGVLTAFTTSMKSLSNPDEPDSTDLVPSAEVKMKEPGSSITAGLAAKVALSSGADMPSSGTTLGDIDMNVPYALGKSEDVPNASTHDKELPEDSDEQLVNHVELQIKILKAVLDGKDVNARDEMKARMSKLVGQSPPQDHVQKGPLYALCEECLALLKQHFIKVRASSFCYLITVSKIATYAGNLNWLVDVMVERKIAQDFVMIWASQSEIFDAYYKLPAEDRHEVSRITATLLAGIGKRMVYANREARYSLLKTWLVPLCDDFEWTKTWSGIDPKLIKDGLVGTIFSLPEPMQREILSVWKGKRLNSGKECPPLQVWYELWWSKSFQ